MTASVSIVLPALLHIFLPSLENRQRQGNSGMNRPYPLFHFVEDRDVAYEFAALRIYSIVPIRDDSQSCAQREGESPAAGKEKLRAV